MEKLRDYIAFDLEFNQHEGVTHLIQVSAVRFQDGKESAAFDSYVHTTSTFKEFYQWFDWNYSRDIERCAESRASFKDFRSALLSKSPIVGFTMHS